MIQQKMLRYSAVWPIDEKAARPPENWQGWLESKKFAFVITHDVETARGLDNCRALMDMEEKYGFRSSFNFVADDYAIPQDLLDEMRRRGFEIGGHGLHHNGNLFQSRNVFDEHTIRINQFLKKHSIVGFRCPSMYHNLDWIHELNIEYDASTFDTDPFEPQPDSAATIFPFWIAGPDGSRGYVELPYTLPQDFLLFILLQEKNIDIWKNKLDWIVRHSGMALFISHPDYMSFNGANHYEKYPAKYYEDFLKYVRTKYEGQYWHALPKEVAAFWQHRKKNDNYKAEMKTRKMRACMLYYMRFQGSAILYREAKALQDKGYDVDIICLRKSREDKIMQTFNGLNMYFIQSRPDQEQKAALYFLRLLSFCLKSFFVLSYLGLKKKYDVVHVTSPPDFIIFAALIPKLRGAGIILDIHDIGPELYMRKLNVPESKPIIRILKWLERISVHFADHVITVTDIWRDKLAGRIDHGKKFSTMMNVPDENLFKLSAARKPLLAEATNLFYHGSFEEHFGVDTLVKAMPIIRQHVPQIKLHLYGDGRLLDAIRDRAAQLGLNGCVIFHGSVPFYELPEILKDADMGIVPTKAAVFSDEALSMKSLEYMTLGIPIVISRTTAHSYYYNEDMVKFFTPEDENDLARKIVALCKDKAERNRLVDNANIFLETHGWGCVKEDYYNIIDEVCSK
jgi:glycosyltransferase involved in cell wall biosynthesis/peptidoglycan/xylan/chitin deacetylase (PgdA/CDA1 family)